MLTQDKKNIIRIIVDGIMIIPSEKKVSRIAVSTIPGSNFEDYIPILAMLVRRFLYKAKGHLYIVFDNKVIHRPAALQDKLQKYLGKQGGNVTVLFLSSYSPNNNPIEQVTTTPPSNLSSVSH
ncbi:MAG: hypothetical protein ACFFC7_11950 [Candidatus Hermodarchaeota archaeon]